MASAGPPDSPPPDSGTPMMAAPLRGPIQRYEDLPRFTAEASNVYMVADPESEAGQRELTELARTFLPSKANGISLFEQTPNGPGTKDLGLGPAALPTQTMVAFKMAFCPQTLKAAFGKMAVVVRCPPNSKGRALPQMSFPMDKWMEGDIGAGRTPDNKSCTWTFKELLQRLGGAKIALGMTGAYSSFNGAISLVEFNRWFEGGPTLRMEHYFNKATKKWFCTLQLPKKVTRASFSGIQNDLRKVALGVEGVKMEWKSWLSITNTKNPLLRVVEELSATATFEVRAPLPVTPG
jgi:hypothetical protein